MPFDFIVFKGKNLKSVLTNQHFVHDDTQTPPVAGWPVPGLQEHLRGDVVGRAHGAVRQLSAVLLPALRPPLAVHWTGSWKHTAYSLVLTDLGFQEQVDKIICGI